MLLRIGFVLVALSSAVLLAETWRGERAELCFVRPENNGAINILESWVRLSDYRVPLLGGQAACVFVEPRSVQITVTSTVPYKPASRNEEACKSNVLRLELAPRESRTFIIWPATRGSTYVCSWRIQSSMGAGTKPHNTSDGR